MLDAKSLKVFEPKWVEWHTHVKINARGGLQDSRHLLSVTPLNDELHNASRILFIEIFKTLFYAWRCSEYMSIRLATSSYLTLTNSEIRRLLAFNLPKPKGAKGGGKVG